MPDNDVTLSKITAEIASALHKELDEPFKRLLGDKVDAWRSTLLRRTLIENPQERLHFRQTIYVKMDKVNPVPECAGTVPVCDIMRSLIKIPTAVRAGNIQYDYVGSVDGKNGFRRKEPGTSYFLTKGKYSKGLVLWDEINDYLEVENVVGIPLIRIDGVFDKPSEVAAFNCASTGTGCDYWNEPYPVSGDIKQAIVQSILKVDFAHNQMVTPTDKDIEVTSLKQEHVPDGR